MLDIECWPRIMYQAEQDLTIKHFRLAAKK
jgi:hypothetical protein